jgi:valacyclovir hydrolase
MPFITARGIDFHYEDAGHGAPMLLLGGTLGTACGDFASQIDDFATGRRVIAPDRRGYGRTRPPDRDYPDDFYQRDAEDMAALMGALELDSATVLGWSEGADVACCLAAMHPEKVERLAVWGGVVKVTDEDIAIFEARRDVASWPGGARKALTEAYGESYWPIVWGKWCDVMVRLHAQGGDVRLAPLERIVCPTLILHGANDPLIRAPHPRGLHNRIAGSELRILDDAGHNLHMTYAEDFNRLIRDFVA